MRKRITHQGTQRVSPSNHQWLNVGHLAQVELTSEDPAYPSSSLDTGCETRLEGRTTWKADNPAALRRATERQA